MEESEHTSMPDDVRGLPKIMWAQYGLPEFSLF